YEEGNILRPFTQGRNSESHHVQTVKEHGGRIGFTNTPGEGAVFWVILPAAGGAECGDLDD
ncbi:MAG: hypothetical protein M1305_06370, partial [Candidatus Marsarchaeota archaeon]|nr:hypothetical protein [Candidatus Marsarchaeota archaeon]